MDENVLWHDNELINIAAKSLKKNNFEVLTAKNSEEAKNKILEIIGKNEIVAFGGSQTVKQINIVEALSQRGQKLILQKSGMKQDEVIELRRKALNADVFIASPNALTLEGSLFFVDRIGNRTSGAVFGPRKVILIAGVNKIVEDDIAALNRVKTKAGPMNSKRLALATPCAKTGLCSDCDSAERICNIYLKIRKKPSYTDYYIVLIPEELGY
ncbi:MAG: lactate utilization protein [Elusimicrobia bacterium]|nr:lactate utilization protein [Elusimicrobiota bacterium]